ncbi:MAG: NusG domain II-containing protein [Eubacteriales bacterium]
MGVVRTKISPGDIIATAAVLLAAVFLLAAGSFSGSGAGYVEITVRSRGTERFDLYHDREIEIESNGITLTVKIENGGVWVGHSDCPDQVCVYTGRIEKGGESIICAPAGVAITITGGGGRDVDHVAG